jgi:hypothetical protein
LYRRLFVCSAFLVVFLLCKFRLLGLIIGVCELLLMAQFGKGSQGMLTIWVTICICIYVQGDDLFWFFSDLPDQQVSGDYYVHICKYK